MFYDRVLIDKAARIPGVKDHRLTASVLPLIALKSEAPAMVENLTGLLLELEHRRREVKAHSKDGTITNALWDRVSEGEIGSHNGDWFVGKNTAKAGFPAIVPLTTTDLADDLKWKSHQVRSTIDSLNLFDAHAPRAVAKIEGKTYRPIWFSQDHFETRLQDFVVDYEPGDLVKALQGAVTKVTQVTDYVSGEDPSTALEGPTPLHTNSVTSVTSVTEPMIDERFENIELLHPEMRRGNHEINEKVIVTPQAVGHNGDIKLDPALVLDFILRTVLPKEQDLTGYAVTTKIEYQCRNRFGDHVASKVNGLLRKLEQAGRIEQKPRPDCWKLKD
jgi:hypothetical protein